MADDEYNALVEKWGEDNVEAAFWLQRRIKQRGLTGIRYMEKSENHLRSTAQLITRAKLKSKMDNEY